MAVTADLVKELRGITNAGMSDCKNALVEADGNIKKAIEILREKGLSAAVEKTGRIAVEGLVHSFVSEDNKTAVILEVNSETDFVAKNDEFKNFVKNISRQVCQSSNTNIDDFLAEKWIADSSQTVLDALKLKISVIGENITIRRFDKFVNNQDGILFSYIHGAGKVAVILYLETDAKYEDVLEAGRNICMQIAAMNPKFKSDKEISNDYIEKEREILAAQLKNEDKPKEIISKMIEGKLNKHLKEVCLLDQEYVKDGDLTVAKYVKSVAKELSANLSIKCFTRYEIGEGLEKKEENFADEVNKVMQG